MPRRKRHPRLPNGYGSIRYLGKNRKNCYSVHPPCTGDGRDEEGKYQRPKALCYVDDWYVGFAVLNAYHAGTYKSGNELLFKSYRDLRLADLQACLDECTLKKASLELIKTLLNQMYRYALPRELCDKDYAQFLTMPAAEDDEHGVPFSDAELEVLWRNRSDPTAEMILIMCYSGYRISAYRKIYVDLESWYFRGGVKTAAGKDRVVPVHTAIRSLVASRISQNETLLGMTENSFRSKMRQLLEALKLNPHTPHDCRHTFSRLCEKYEVKEADRKRMMGHSFGSDITNAVYGHRTLEDLRAEIEKIQVPWL
ncbi:MAG: integrase [Clostridiales bacterium]|nr:integrase [Clostridiales bacterium]